MDWRELTVKDKILLYLLDYPKEEILDIEDFDKDDIIKSLPFEITQEGVAEGTELKWNHVSRALKSLEKEGLVEEKKGNIYNGRRRRFVYLLTSKGKQKAYLDKERILENDVIVLTDGEVQSVRLRSIFPADNHLISFLNRLKSTIRTAVDFDKALKSFNLQHERKFIIHTPGLPNYEVFYGRETQIDNIMSSLKDKHAVINISGIAGIGKTSIANEVIKRSRFNNNLFYYSFKTHKTTSDLIHEISIFLSSMGLTNLSSYLQNIPHQYGLIDEKSLLTHNQVWGVINTSLNEINGVIILDDVHLKSDSVEPFFSILADHGNPKLRIMQLSRERITFRHNQSPGDNHCEIILNGLREDEASQILTGKGIETSEEIHLINERFKGHPYALILIKNPLGDHLSFNSYLHDEILNQLSMAEKRILRKLSVFRDPVDSNAIIEHDEEFDAFDSLLSKGLIIETKKEGFYLHDIICQSLHSGHNEGAFKQYHNNAANYYRSFNDYHSTFELLHHLYCSNQNAELIDIIIDSGIPLLFEMNQLDLLSYQGINGQELDPIKYKMFLGITNYYNNNILEGIRTFQEIVGSTCDHNQKITIYRYLGGLNFKQGNWSDALNNLDEALIISISQGLKSETCLILIGIGRVNWRSGNNKEATTYLKRAEQLGIELKDNRLLSEIYHDLGLLSKHEPSGLEYMEKSLSLAEIDNNIFLIARSYNNLGILSYINGRIDEAKVYWESNVIYSGTHHINTALAFSKANLASIYSDYGEYDKAIAGLEEAIDIFENSLDIYGTIFANSQFADTYLQQKDYLNAEKYIKIAIETTEKIGGHQNIGSFWEMYGDIVMSQGRREESISHYQKAIQVFTEMGNQNKISIIKDKMKD